MVVLSRPMCGLLSIHFASSRGFESYKGRIDIDRMGDSFIWFTPKEISQILGLFFSQLLIPFSIFAGRQANRSFFRQGHGTPVVRHIVDLHRIKHQHAFPQLKVGVIHCCVSIFSLFQLSQDLTTFVSFTGLLDLSC